MEFIPMSEAKATQEQNEWREMMQSLEEIPKAAYIRLPNEWYYICKDFEQIYAWLRKAFIWLSERIGGLFGGL